MTNIERVDTQSLIHIIRINKPIEDVIKQLALSLKESVDYVDHISGLMNATTDPALVYCYFKIIIFVLYYAKDVADDHIRESNDTDGPISFEVIKYNRTIPDKITHNTRVFEDKLRSFSNEEMFTFNSYKSTYRVID